MAASARKVGRGQWLWEEEKEGHWEEERERKEERERGYWRGEKESERERAISWLFRPRRWWLRWTAMSGGGGGGGERYHDGFGQTVVENLGYNNCFPKQS